MINRNKIHRGVISQFLKLAIFGVLLFVFSMSVSAQLSLGGTPLKSQSLSEPEWINLEQVRVDELLLEDKWLSLTGKKNHRIAKELQVSISPEQQGNWEQLRDGTLIWRIGIRGRGARGLGLVFSRYVLAEGTRLYIYDPSGENVLGAYTNRNNKVSGYLPVSYLPGDEMIIQLEVPQKTENYGELHIGSVRQAYLPVFEEKSVDDKYFGTSGDCNVDINCTLGDDWQLVKNSVVRMISTEKCTGVLINNVRQDDKAYVYTAAHCVFQSNKLQPIVFYFNYESPTCDGPDGSVSNSISLATLVATGDTLENPRDADSLDFALLELSVAPPDSFLPYFAGWNRSPTPAQHTTTIHHPSGDVKKIALDLDPPEVSYHDPDYFEDLIRGSHWRIMEWDTATTEFGSSGCPLFNEDQLVVGTLTGGQATCSFQENDYFTRLDYAWDYYPDSTKQLKCWLDPDDTGVMSLAGKVGDSVVDNVSISRAPEIESLSLYPNPANQLVTVRAGLESHRETHISIYHITGKLIMHKSISWEDKTTLDVSELQAGFYVFRLSQDNRFATSRLVISR
ncbi:T9SS type A sorting domain-containing protein [Bacteroidota bacterium]